MSNYAVVNAWLIDAVTVSPVTKDSEFGRLIIPRLEAEPVGALPDGAVSILRHVWGKQHGRRFSATYLAATADFDVRAGLVELVPMAKLDAIAAHWNAKGPNPYASPRVA